MKLLIIIGLAVVVTATSHPESPQVVRIGSVGVTISNIKGTVVPKGDASAAVPLFEFKSSEPGTPEHETESYKFRCNVITELYHPDTSNPVLICRNPGFNKGSPDSSEKKAFIFTHSDLKLSPNVKEIELVVGKTTVSNFVSTHSSVAPVTRKKLAMEGVYDGFKLIEGSSLYHTLLAYTH